MENGSREIPCHSELIVFFKEALEEIKKRSEKESGHLFVIEGYPYTATSWVKRGKENIVKILPGLFRENGSAVWMIRCDVFCSRSERTVEEVLGLLASRINAGLLLRRS